MGCEHEISIDTRLLDKLKKMQELGAEVPVEMFDFLDVIINGAKKYQPNNWLSPFGVTMAHDANHDSMFHHLAESFSGVEKDKDSGMDPRLHLACRALMSYTRDKLDIPRWYSKKRK
jgi:hypothetical protein